MADEPKGVQPVSLPGLVANDPFDPLNEKGNLVGSHHENPAASKPSGSLEPGQLGASAEGQSAGRRPDATKAGIYHTPHGHGLNSTIPGPPSKSNLSPNSGTGEGSNRYTGPHGQHESQMGAGGEIVRAAERKAVEDAVIAQARHGQPQAPDQGSPKSPTTAQGRPQAPTGKPPSTSSAAPATAGSSSSTTAAINPVLTGVRNGMQLPDFQGRGRWVPWLPSAANCVLRAVRALVNPRVIWGNKDEIIISDSNWLLTLDSSRLSPPPAPGGGITPRGLYNGSIDYKVNDLVYTQPDDSSRVAWVCHVANGPSSSVQSPTWPEPAGTVFWTAYARGGAGSTLYYLTGTVEDDYLNCGIGLSVSPTVKIGKPPLLRAFLAGTLTESIFSVLHTYKFNVAAGAYDGLPHVGPDARNIMREDNDGSSAEYQMVVPIWEFNNFIYAIPCPPFTARDGSIITQIMVSDSRQWAFLP
jgi:hypothetical protein